MLASDLLNGDTGDTSADETPFVILSESVNSEENPFKKTTNDVSPSDSGGCINMVSSVARESPRC